MARVSCYWQDDAFRPETGIYFRLLGFLWPSGYAWREELCVG